MASGQSFGLLEIPGDTRYILLFILALSPLFLAFINRQGRRGWALAAVGNLLIYLTVLLPAIAGNQLIVDAAAMFEEGTRISNPRILTSGAMALGLLGGYVILFAGLIDLEEMGTSQVVRALTGVIGVFLVVVGLLNGTFDIFSIMVEYNTRGDTLAQRFIEHIVFVIVALVAGLIIGLALGLWASRDKRAKDIILYSVSIIQTIPSLALFGVLLVPLARLGNQSFSSIFRVWLLMVLIAAAIVVIVRFIAPLLPMRFSQVSLALASATAFVPIGLLVMILISFGFEVILNIFTLDDIGTARNIVLGALITLPILVLANRQLDPLRDAQWLLYLRYSVSIVLALGLVYLLWVGGSRVVGSQPLGELTARDLGVSGIGTAPAIIALTLYSLLPLVRNTYAGLTNIDPAIIDSGRGMGMTPSQIFFQIELPLAFPVIMAGVRNAGISLVGITALASVIGAGALGDFILLGINSTSIDQILLGTIPAIVLAVFLDAILQAVEGLFTSPGIRQT